MCDDLVAICEQVNSLDLPKVAFQARFLLLNRIWHYVWRRRQSTVTFSSCAPQGIVPCARMAS